MSHKNKMIYGMVLMMSTITFGTPSHAQKFMTEEDFLRALTQKPSVQSSREEGVRKKSKHRGITFNSVPEQSDPVRRRRGLTEKQKRLIARLAHTKRIAHEKTKHPKRKRVTRGITFGLASEAPETYETDRAVKTTRHERKELAKMIQENDLSSVDIEINFASNSAVLQPRSKRLLAKLGGALKKLNGTVMLSGHTDARGSADYNLKLSEKRADAVKAYLVEEIGIDEGRLLAVGNGEEQLKNARKPNAGMNRRVQIVNMEG